MIRTFEHSKAEKLAAHSQVPVINGLTDEFHPCQVMADLMTIYEKFNSFKVKWLTLVMAIIWLIPL